MIKRLLTQAGVAATVVAFSVGAQAAVVTSNVGVLSADMTTLYSGTLDVACTQGGGQFFTCTNVAEVLGLATSVAITNTNNNGGGSLNLTYDDVSGEILSVNSLNFSVGDMSIFISHIALGTATVSIVSPNGVPTPTDVPTVLAGTAGINGTADADSNAAASIFQHDAAGQTDATDFSTFTDIVDSCLPLGAPVCALIPVLAIDGIRYELTGTVSNAGVFALALRSETSNNSNYFIDLTAQVVPVPAAVWLFGSALGLLGWMRRRTA